MEKRDHAGMLSLLLDVGSTGLQHRICGFLKARRVSFALVGGSNEPVEILADMQWIGFNPDGLLLGRKRPVSTVRRMILEFHSLLPKPPPRRGSGLA